MLLLVACFIRAIIARDFEFNLENQKSIIISLKFKRNFIAKSIVLNVECDLNRTARIANIILKGKWAVGGLASWYS